MSVTGHIIGDWNLSGEVNDSGGTTVIANPSGSATDTLNKVQIDETIYSVEGGGGTEVIANPTGTPTENINTIEISDVIYQIVGEEGPQGPKGDTGDSGTDGVTPEVTASATVNSSTGTPSVTVTKSGTTTAPNFAFAFSNLKGETGATGPQGPKGDTGETGQTGQTGPQGPAGEGVPTGGSAGQVLVKDSATNYDTSWTTLDASDIPYDNTSSGMTATDVQDAVSELKSNLTWKLVDQQIGSILIQVPVDFEEVYVVCRFGNSGGLQAQVVAETIPKIHWFGGLAFTFGAGTMFAQVTLTNDYKITMNAFQVSGTTYTTTSQITVYYR